MISSRVRLVTFLPFRCQLTLTFEEISKSPVSKVPPELAKHEAAQHRITRDMKRRRDAEDQG